jgi:hypothetical protein
MRHDAELAALLADIVIAHQTPGRVRLKLLRLPESLRAELDATSLTRFFVGLRQIPGITQVRLNALAKSCTIIYAPALLPDQVWREALAVSAPLSPAARDFRAKLQQHYLHSKPGQEKQQTPRSAA